MSAPLRAAPTPGNAPALFLAAALLAAAGSAQVDPAGRSILFVRGADGTGGGATGGSFQERTALLSDVFDDATSPGNSGYGALRQLLQADGFQVAQWVESGGALTLALLQPHRIVVLGSNNRSYSAAEVQAFHDYIDQGGSALVVSDANWGPAWGSAPNSDNLFLARYGLEVYQDNGAVTTLLRSDPGRYLVPDHPVLAGSDGLGGADVHAYDGEGVSPFRIGASTPGWQAIPLVAATGQVVRLNTATGIGGTYRFADEADANLVVVERGASRLVGHFDRNTFFNPNGAGTDLTRRDNALLALGIFRFLAAVPASARPLGIGCGAPVAPSLAASPPVLGRPLVHRALGAPPSTVGVMLLAVGAATPAPLPGGCTLWLDPNQLVVAAAAASDATGRWRLSLSVPGDLAWSATTAISQVLFLGAGGLEASNGLALTLGFPR